MWSSICGKITIIVHKITLKKSVKKWKDIKLKNLNALFCFKAIFWTHGNIFCLFYKSETLLSKQFFSIFLVLFFILSSKMSTNMRKLRVKLPNATIPPPPPYRSNFSKHTSPSLPNFPQIEKFIMRPSKIWAPYGGH